MKKLKGKLRMKKTMKKKKWKVTKEKIRKA